ncbi:hypothetical protein K457DRAFT_441405 [Linnemannia elongata AG-77]|uniref:Uncharacterized protein n=1 Tax=Linnemannia elongata AG-77 TaxID=1314771 RepID=A0A197K0D5_9FUNG|nr:hypothetical protein K457DRAFT_441405 [Linnemannia elongata AG-77]
MPVLPPSNGHPDPTPIYTDNNNNNNNKKAAFKDMLRQRQTALRNNRNNASSSDTQSRRSGASAGGSNGGGGGGGVVPNLGNRSFYPSPHHHMDGHLQQQQFQPQFQPQFQQQQQQQQFQQQFQPQHHHQQHQQQQQQQPHYADQERGISLQSLREEASIQSQWNLPPQHTLQQQQQQQPVGHNTFNNGNNRAQHINGVHDDPQGGIIIHGLEQPTTRRQQQQQQQQQQGSEPEIFTKNWNQGQQLSMDSQVVNNNDSNHIAGQDSNNKGGVPVSQDAYDLREMLLQQRASIGKRHSQDDSEGHPPKSQAKNQAKDVHNATQGSEGNAASNILTIGLRGSPQQDPPSSSAQDFQDSDTIIFLPRGNRIENPSSSSLQSGPTGNTASSGAPESKTKKAAKQEQQPSITLVTSGSLASSISAPLLSPTTTRMKSTTSSIGNNSPTTTTSIKLSVINTSASSKFSAAGMSSEGLPLSTKFSKISSSSQPSSPISTKTPTGNSTKPSLKPGTTAAPVSTKPLPKFTPTTPVSAQPAAQPSASHASTPPTSTSNATAPAKQTEPGANGGSDSDGNITREEQLRQQVQATLKKKAANQSDTKNEFKTAPIILSTARKAQPESNSEDQAYPAKRPKIGSSSSNSGNDAVVGLSLEAIRIERAALDASAALTASPTTTSTMTTSAATGSSVVTGNSGTGSGASGGLSSQESKVMAPRNRNQSSDPRYDQVRKDSTDDRTKESSSSTTHQESSRGQDRSDSRGSTSNRDQDEGRESDRSYTRRQPSPRSLGRGGYDRDGDRGWYGRGTDRGGYERRDDREYDRRDDRSSGYGRSGYDSRGFERGGDHGYSRYNDVRTSDRRRDGSKDRGADRSRDRSGTDRTSDRDKAAAGRAPPPPPASSDKKKTKQSETEERAEQGSDQQKEQQSSDKPAAVDRIMATATVTEANNKISATSKGGVRVEGGAAAAATGVDSPKDADGVMTKIKAEPMTLSVPQAPEEPPILFAAANRLQAELNSSPSGQPQHNSSSSSCFSSSSRNNSTTSINSWRSKHSNATSQ